MIPLKRCLDSMQKSCLLFQVRSPLKLQRQLVESAFERSFLETVGVVAASIFVVAVVAFCTGVGHPYPSLEVDRELGQVPLVPFQIELLE